jgi:hypothetical protein
VSALDVNEMDPGHPDERGDCGPVALKIFLGIKYTESLRAAVRLDAEEGRNGLWLRTIQRIAFKHGTAEDFRLGGRLRDHRHAQPRRRLAEWLSAGSYGGMAVGSLASRSPRRSG